MAARTLYLQVGDLTEAGYPVRLGVVEDGQPGAVTLEPAGTLPAVLPPRSADDRLGRYLHELVAGAAGARLAELTQASKPSSVVVDVRPADLAALPWEMLDAGQRFPLYPFTDADRPWSRGHWQTSGHPAWTLGPLRVLVVVCDPKDATLRAEDEIDGIHRAVAAAPGRIYVEVIDSPPTWDALKARIVELAPQVVHFIGHTRKSGQQSVLEFTPGPPHKTWELSSTVVATSWPRGPRLVVVSACRSGGTPASGVASLTEALQARDVPATLGMRGDITSSAAVAFAADFYASLAAGQPVDAAAAAGRQAAYDRDPGALDWHYPVLETLVPASHVLPIRFAAGSGHALQAFPEFAELRSFVDRTEQRRKTWWAIDPEDIPGQHVARSALITGPKESGKTWLAKASLLILHLRGRRLHYIDLKAEQARAELGESTKDWLRALRAIRDGTKGCHLSPELDPHAFSDFNAELNWLLKHQPRDAPVPGSGSVTGPVRDEWEAFDPDAGQAQARIGRIFAAFRAALARAAAPQHTVLALDEVGQVMEQSWRDYLLPELIAPLARGDVPGVSLLLIMPNDLLPRRVPAAEAALFERVEVREFELAQVDRLIREYIVYSQLSPSDLGRIRPFIGNAPKFPPGAFSAMEMVLRMFDQGGG
jgi:hypothetical protein